MDKQAKKVIAELVAVIADLRSFVETISGVSYSQSFTVAEMCEMYAEIPERISALTEELIAAYGSQTLSEFHNN
jgi:hypothetical protein